VTTRHYLAAAFLAVVIGYLLGVAMERSNHWA
jgi:ABC-type nitrate/sulfonate/bicarbonate transport system permease component